MAIVIMFITSYSSSLHKFLRYILVLLCCLAVAAPSYARNDSHKSKHKKHKKHAAIHRVINRSTPHTDSATSDNFTLPKLASSKVLVLNQATGDTLYAKNTDEQTPIASLTKLMTAMVVLDAKQPLDEWLYITDEDVDHLKDTHSRLSIGTALTRWEFLHLALIASENRAASALGRHYTGGIQHFVEAMNRKAASLGMSHTHFVDSSGLNSANVSTAQDLAKMVNAAYQYPEIRKITTTPFHEIIAEQPRKHLKFMNTNALVRTGNWIIGLSKTGFIKEAGRCLVMQAEISGQPTIIVLLDSVGKLSRIGDANRIRKWLEHHDVPHNT